MYRLFCLLICVSANLAATPPPVPVVTIQSYSTVINQVGHTVIQPFRYGTGLQTRPGWILTAAHVVEDGERLRVTLPQGQTVPAYLHATDPYTDLALLTITPKKQVDQTTIIFVTAALGTPLLAYGNAQGEGIQASQGVVSFHGFSQKNHYRIPLVSADIQAKPGYSGGPLVDEKGQIVGIITHIDANTRGDTYAVDGPTIRATLNRLYHQQTTQVWALGLHVVATEPIEQAFSLGLPSGLQITAITATSPLQNRLQAAHYQLLRQQHIPWGGDIILAINNKPVTTVREARQALWLGRSKSTVQLRFQRFSGGQFELILPRAIARKPVAPVPKVVSDEAWDE